jgi:hypothetical protein
MSARKNPVISKADRNNPNPPPFRPPPPPNPLLPNRTRTLAAAVWQGIFDAVLCCACSVTVILYRQYSNRGSLLNLQVLAITFLALLASVFSAWDGPPAIFRQRCSLGVVHGALLPPLLLLLCSDQPSLTRAAVAQSVIFLLHIISKSPLSTISSADFLAAPLAIWFVLYINNWSLALTLCVVVGQRVAFIQMARAIIHTCRQNPHLHS